MTKRFMSLALEEAKLALLENEVPIGCIIVKSGEVIARAHNTKNTKNDVTCHAEINAIKIAQKKLNSTILEDCEMYSTAEPCLMCSGAIIQTRIKRLYYGTKEPKFGAHNSKYNILANEDYNHKIEVHAGVLEDECKNILKEFFKNKR